MTHHTDADRAEFELMRDAFESKGSEDYKAYLVELRSGGSYRQSDIADAFRNWQTAWQAARRAQVMPQGWKLVPVEPTPQMVQAGRAAPLAGESNEDAPEDYKSVYRAMLAAAPQSPAMQFDRVEHHILVQGSVSAPKSAPQPPQKHRQCTECNDTGVGVDHGYDCTSCYGAMPSAPQPPEAAPVQLPDACGRVSVNEDGDSEVTWRGGFPPDDRTRLYTEHQVRQLLAQHSIHGRARKANERWFVMEWQEFQTAPKDGSVFLCAWRSGKVTLMKWFGKYFDYETAEAVCCSSSLLTNNSYSDKEMYWMPLPQPPAT